MARKIECDRCKRVRPGKYYRVSVVVAEHFDDGIEGKCDDMTKIIIEDCCEHCLKTITKCVTLKKKRPSRPRKKTSARRAKKTTRKVSKKDETTTFDATQASIADLPTPSGKPSKPVVPPAPEVP